MDELNSRLSTLEIQILEGEDGKLTAVSNSEPLFCYVRDSEEELRNLVVDTIQRYIRTFYHAEAVVQIEEKRPVPIVNLRPRRVVSPKFASSALSQEGLAVA